MNMTRRICELSRPGAGFGRPPAGDAARAGGRRLQDHPAGLSTGSLGAATSPPPVQAAEWRAAHEAWGERYRANPNDPEAAIGYAQALRGDRPARAGGGRARAGRDRKTRSISACSAPMAARWPTSATTSRRSTCSTARTRRTSRTGASCRCRARCSTRWAATRTRSATTPPRCGSCPTSRRSCPISACPTRCRRISSGAEVDAAARVGAAAGRSAGAAEPRAGGRAAGPLRRRRRRSRRPTCRPTRRPPMSPICGRCWRSRTAGRPGASRRSRPRQRSSRRCATPHAIAGCALLNSPRSSA